MSMWVAVKRALRLLSKRDQRILGLLVLVQVFLSLLDLLGVASIGVVVLISSSALTGTAPSGLASTVSNVVGPDRDPDSLAIFLAVLAGFLLITKSLLSYALTRRTFRFLANRQAMIASDLAATLLSQSLLDVEQRTSQETVLTLTRSVSQLTMGVLGGAVIVISEGSLLILLVTALAFVDLTVTVFAAVFFAIVALSVQKVLSGWTHSIGMRNYRAEVGSITTMQEALRSYREIAVAGRRGDYVNRFQSLRWDVASAEADLRLVNIVTKYIYEVALVIGGGALAVSQFFTKDATAALTILAIFLAAATRLLPSVMRLQTAAFSIRAASAESASAIQLHAELGTRSATTAVLSLELSERATKGLVAEYPGFEASVRVARCTLRYPGVTEPALDAVDLTIVPGTSVALVGTTGAGKSTLADVILGVLQPDTGTVAVSGLAPSEAILHWPGAIAYVPQVVTLIDGSVRANVALGLPDENVSDDFVWEALERAHLASFLIESREGLHTLVGEGGIRLSGGQRQRLGLARALYTRPRLIVLDEATSALDAETESLVTQTLEAMGRDVTRIIVAHRLTTIRSADQVVYLESGRIRSIGGFDQVTAEVPDFHRQAHLLGLT